MTSPVELKQARTEWDAWQVVCAMLKVHGVEINDADKLHAAITAWGEELVALRLLQEERVRDHAHAEATQRFDAVFPELVVRDPESWQAVAREGRRYA